MSSDKDVGQPEKHFSGKRVRKSLIHFLLGKSFVSVLSFVIAIIIVRELSISDYASYTAIIGLILFATLISNLGLERTIPKFISAQRQKDFFKNLKALSWFLLGVRLVSLTIIVVVFFLAGALIFNIFNIPFNQSLLVLLALYFLFYGMSMHLIRTLQSLLLQKESNIGMFVEWFVKLLLLIVMIYYENHLTLVDLLSVQVFSIMLGVLVNFYMLISHLLGIREGSSVQESQLDWRGVFNFSIQNYFHTLTGFHVMPSSGRLFASMLLVQNSVAAIGFAYALVEAIKRFLPARLLLGLIEPVVMARYDDSKNYSEVTLISKIVLKLNLFLIFPAMIWVVLEGEYLLDLITNNKFGEYAWLISAMLLLATIESRRGVLTLISNAVDRSDFLIKSNLYSLLFLPLFVLSIMHYDLYGFVVALGLILIYRNWYVAFKLRKLGYAFPNDIVSLIKIIINAIVSVVIAHMITVEFTGNNLLQSAFSLLLSMFFYLALSYFLKPFNSVESSKLNAFFGKRLFIW